MISDKGYDLCAKLSASHYGPLQKRSAGKSAEKQCFSLEILNNNDSTSSYVIDTPINVSIER